MKRLALIASFLLIGYLLILLLTLPNAEQRRLAVETVDAAYSLSSAGDYDTLRLSEDIGSFGDSLQQLERAHGQSSSHRIVSQSLTWRPTANYRIEVEAQRGSRSYRETWIVLSTRTTEMGRDFVRMKSLTSRLASTAP